MFLKMYVVKTSYYSSLQGNQVKAEEFFFRKGDYDLMIIGSSMSEEINISIAKKNTKTLNFMGGGVITGLELIKRKNNPPNAIIIETNWLERPLDQDLTRPIFNQFYSKILKYFPFTQEKNHPINVLTGEIVDITHVINFKNAIKYRPFYMRNNFDEENKNVNKRLIKKSAKEVRSYIDYFQKKGVKIYLMELPTHQNIYNTKRNIETRRYIKEFFQDISKIPPYPQQLDSLQTYDGNHLVESSREKYSAFLTKFLTNHKNDWDRNP